MSDRFLNDLNIDTLYEEHTMSLVGGTSNYTGTSAIKIVRVGNVVTISSTAILTHTSSNTPTSGNVLIPAQFRPTNQMVACFLAGGPYHNILVYPTGVFSTQYLSDTGVFQNRTSSLLACSISYVIT